MRCLLELLLLNPQDLFIFDGNRDPHTCCGPFFGRGASVTRGAPPARPVIFWAVQGPLTRRASQHPFPMRPDRSLEGEGNPRRYPGRGGKQTSGLPAPRLGRSYFSRILRHRCRPSPPPDPATPSYTVEGG